jgi:Na+-translocating ferredoxin:NAD+ oxidoreductase RnfD subunit
MNEMQLVLLGLILLGASVIFFYLTDIVPAKIENTEMSIIISLGIGLLVLVIDKRQSRYLEEIIQTQHKMTNEIHKMIKEELTIIKGMHRDNQNG